MSDNPRAPGHPSDIPSSRSTGDQGHSSSNPANPYTSPPAAAEHSKMSPQLRTIVIGAAVTVFSSVLIYYLTVYMNKPKSDAADIIKVKEATTAAWKSYLAYENTYTKNMLVYEKDIAQTGVDKYLLSLKAESEKYVRDVEDLKETKNIDKDLVKVLNRRLENEHKAMAQTEAFVKNLKEIVASNQSDSLKGAAALKLMEKNHINSNSFFQAAINDIEEIAKTLSERYVQPFSMNDFLIVQIMPQRLKTEDSLIKLMKGIDPNDDNFDETDEPVDSKKLIGSWKDGKNKLTLQSNGKMSYILSFGLTGTGIWKIENNKLQLSETGEDGKEKSSGIFKLSNIKDDSFLMKRDATPFEIYHFTRVKSQ